MATPAQVAELRLLVDDSAEPQLFSNQDLATYIDAANADSRVAAGTVWGVKASKFAGLVDVTEGSSSRKMSQLYKQALEMAAFYGTSIGETTGTVTTARSGTRAITRPTA